MKKRLAVPLSFVLFALLWVIISFAGYLPAHFAIAWVTDTDPKGYERLVPLLPYLLATAFVTFSFVFYAFSRTVNAGALLSKVAKILFITAVILTVSFFAFIFLFVH